MKPIEILNEIKKICKESAENSPSYDPCSACPFSTLTNRDCIFDNGECGNPSEWGEFTEKISIIFK